MTNYELRMTKICYLCHILNFFKLAYYAEIIGQTVDKEYQYFVRIGLENGGFDYEKEFKKHNYYNISDFEQVWKDTRYGGTWYPGMPE